MVCLTQESQIREYHFFFSLQIAITGESFFAASALATELIKNNILRIGKVNVIGNVILFLGKLCVSLASALFAFLMLDTHAYKSAHDKVSSPLIPVLVSFLTAFHDLRKLSENDNVIIFI